MTASTSNSALSPASLIAQAFKCDEVVATKTTTGVQTMAAAIFAHHAEKESRRATFGALSERGAAFDEFKKEIVTAHITARVKPKDGKADVVAATNMRNHAQMVLLGKGFDLAFALHSVGVSLASFVPHKDGGVFHVPVNSLVANDDTPLGALAMAVKGDKRIPLDGRTYACESDGKFTNIKAFPARVLEVAGYKKPGAKKATPTPTPSNGASDTSTTGGSDAASVRSDPNTWSFAALVSGAADLLLRAHDIAKEGEAVSWASLDEKTRNALEGLVIFRDECKAVDATAPTQEKVAA